MIAKTNVTIKRLDNGAELPLPAYATQSAAGMDLTAAITEPVTLQPNVPVIIPTGIAIALPEGFEAQVRPRSGLAAKNGITVLNAPGTIDADYRGEVGVILINLSKVDFVVEPAMRIAQMVVAPYTQVEWVEADNLDDTARGAGGFGSTGTKAA